MRYFYKYIEENNERHCDICRNRFARYSIYIQRPIDYTVHGYGRVTYICTTCLFYIGQVAYMICPNDEYISKKTKIPEESWGTPYLTKIRSQVLSVYNQLTPDGFHKKIAAIKELRKLTGLGLKEAVEQLSMWVNGKHEWLNEDVKQFVENNHIRR